MGTNEDVEFINTPMPKALFQRVSLEAGRLLISRAELMRRAIVDYLEKLEPEKITNEGNN